MNENIKHNNFDLLRLFAAFQVLIVHSFYHLYTEHNLQLPSGINTFLKFINFFPGVSIFFLISGFLIALSFDKNSNIVEYAKNRILRIYPALYVNIILSVLVLYYFGFVQFNCEFFSWLLAHTTIVQFYNPEMFRGFGVGVINGSLWTISVELSFYILLPFLMLLFTKNRFYLFFFLLASFMIWMYDLSSSKEFFFNKLLHSSILPYLFLFVIGIFFYKYLESLKKYFQDKFLLWFMIYIAFGIMIEYFSIEKNFLYYFFKWAIFSFLIFLFAFSYRNFSEKLLKRNDYTYGVYIYHMLIINIFVYLDLVGQSSYVISIIVLSLIFGIFSWHIIEKPFLGMKKRSIFHELHKK